MRFRMIRAEGLRAIVRVDQRTTTLARAVWNARIESRDGRTYQLSTVRVWGTLVGAKVWIRSTPSG